MLLVICSLIFGKFCCVMNILNGFCKCFDLFWTYSIWTKDSAIYLSFHKAVQGCFVLDFTIAFGFCSTAKNNSASVSMGESRSQAANWLASITQPTIRTRSAIEAAHGLCSRREPRKCFLHFMDCFWQRIM